MRSSFLPGQPLASLDEVEDGQLYHVLLSDQRVGTVQRRGDTWLWRRLMGGTSQRGDRAALEIWLANVLT
ncbi:hypothetical protein GCM10022631_04650 [Deinococcus rubellus]|uniref:Uncharacterized protein n=1 Tax=Deinococcus rubellus TaxID=1889240 RepID=A0ABY5YGY0_9DEIO|nr:hypothetical protein [Deinococcus rubellus]UWX64181.1 hypothetical protein N0D28_00425 [Deinococcus rubellus]